MKKTNIYLQAPRYRLLFFDKQSQYANSYRSALNEMKYINGTSIQKTPQVLWYYRVYFLNGLWGIRLTFICLKNPVSKSLETTIWQQQYKWQ